MSTAPGASRPTVALVTLGCARNEVDSEELAGRLEAGGFDLVEDAEHASAILVNTCGFVEAAKKDSIDTLLEAADLKGPAGPQAVVAVGCLAERYGAGLAESLAGGRCGPGVRRLPGHRRPAVGRSCTASGPPLMCPPIVVCCCRSHPASATRER